MANIVFYRDKCIGCGICFELQPERWRMSRKDGKAILLMSIAKKDLFVLKVDDALQQQTIEVARACPVKIIKI